MATFSGKWSRTGGSNTTADLPGVGVAPPAFHKRSRPTLTSRTRCIRPVLKPLGSMHLNGPGHNLGASSSIAIDILT
jgi:hypothetical protein